jgi:spore coat protein CotF
MNHPNYSAMATTGATRSTHSSMESSGSMGLTDKDLMQILLYEHKLMASAMTSCILESSNQQLRHDCMNLLNRDFEHQKMIFDAMHQRGWYPVQAAAPQDIQRAQQALNQQMQELKQHQHLQHQHTGQQHGQQQFGQTFNQPPSMGQQHFGYQPQQQQSFMQQQNYSQQPFTQSGFTQRP